jgi:CheY-like chemotaxis protein
MAGPEAARTDVLWIGDSAAAEFGSIRARLASTIRLETAASVGAALDWLAAVNTEPALLIFAQRWPGQFPADRVDRLRQLSPLARCLALLGPWCEGEPRSGKPLPGVQRLYWHQWSPHVEGELRKLIRGEPCEWSLPETATEEERSSLSHGARVLAGCKPLVAIQAHDREAAAALADVLTSAGYASVWLRPGQASEARGVSAVLVDLDYPSEGPWRELAECHKRWSPAPVLALLGFPRPDDAARATQLGARALLSKPLRSAHLLAELGPGKP